MRVVEGPNAALASARKRYGLGTPTSASVMICRLEDALLAFQPADEAEEIGVLVHQADRRRENHALRAFASARQRLVMNAFDRYGAAVCDTKVAQLRTGYEVLQAWVDAAGLSRHAAAKRGQMIAERVRHLDAMAKWPESQPIAFRPAVAGEAALIRVDELAPLLGSAAQSLDLEEHTAQRIVEQVRRLRRDEPDPDSTESGAPVPPIPMLDRVDAICTIFDTIALAKSAVLLSSARALLGRVLRDAGCLQHLLQATPYADGASRRAAVVALGLLGQAVDFELAVPQPMHTADVEAYVLSAVVTLDPSIDATRAGVAARVPTTSWQVVDRARARLRAGMWLTAIER